METIMVELNLDHSLKPYYIDLEMYIKCISLYAQHKASENLALIHGDKPFPEGKTAVYKGEKDSTVVLNLALKDGIDPMQAAYALQDKWKETLETDFVEVMEWINS